MQNSMIAKQEYCQKEGNLLDVISSQFANNPVVTDA
jgi:hypothetical protein